MRLARFGSVSPRVSAWFRAALATVLTVVAAGCPTVPPPDDNNNGNSNQNGNGNTSDEAEIISPSTSFGISELENPVSVLYTVSEDAENIRGYYVPVSGGASDSPEIGPRVVAAANLEPGERQAFSFDPGEAGVGYFRVGILYSVGGGADETAESDAVIQVQGPPDPVFILPPDDINEVRQGDTVQITFDVRDPDAIAQWRLFRFTPPTLPSVPIDQLGTEITSGSGNVGSVILLTDDLPLGDYQLGLSATDSGRSISGTVEADETHRIVTIPAEGSVTPIIRVIAAP